MGRLTRLIPARLRLRPPVFMAPRPLTEKELAHLRTRRDRQERYVRNAMIVQSKWFMVGGAVVIALFLLAVYLVSSG